MITQDLGIATAYGYAKSKGYTGTEEEFAELMASYAEVGQTAVDAKDAAVAANTAAQTAATTATNKASEATTAATTATTKAGEASTSASTATSAKDTAVSASQTATTKATEATTAAATATSAKTDAVAANAAAQSAKTAAQTAQTGAETAAASVQSSAAQIATNTEDIAQLKSDLNTITGVVRVDYIVGKAVKTLNNPLTMENGTPVPTDTDSNWKCAIIPCTEGDKFIINGATSNHQYRAWYFANSSGAYVSESASPFDDVTNTVVITAPPNAAWLILNSTRLPYYSYKGEFIQDTLDSIKTNITAQSTIRDVNDSQVINAFSSCVNPIEIDDVTFADLQINSGGIVSASTIRKCAICRIVPNTYIKINKIQTTFAWIGFSTKYPTAGTVLNRQDAKNGVDNTEIGLQSESNDNYMIFMYYDSNDTPTAADVEESMHVYYDSADFSQFDMIAHADSHLINLLKYRPVGRVQKPYIAISCDDGNAVLATYTIPRIKEWKQTYGKNIPVTFALFNTSDVMVNTTYKALTIDACENDGCAIAIHGVHSFFNYTTRKQLMDYIQTQDDYLYAETGIKPNAVIYPEHDYNDFIQTFCGSFYGACGCGGNTHNLAYEDASGRPFYIGEKSNCYEIYRLAIHDTRITSLEDVEDIVDYAYDHNLIICPYFHDVDLGDSAPNKDFLRSVLDKFVSYGVSKGIDFIKLGDIPNVL